MLLAEALLAPLASPTSDLHGAVILFGESGAKGFVNILTISLIVLGLVAHSLTPALRLFPFFKFAGHRLSISDIILAASILARRLAQYHSP
jgi:hypothetical protein